MAKPRVSALASSLRSHAVGKLPAPNESLLAGPGGYSGFQVTGIIEGFFLGLKFSILGIFWVGKFGKYFLG